MTHIGLAATEPLYDLAEGIVWDDRADRLRWVDIGAGRVLSGRIEGTRVVDVQSVGLGQNVGAIALADDGGLLVVVERGLAAISASGDLSFGPDLLEGHDAVRFNDGSVDPQGRFIVGTVALGHATGTETLLRVSPDGAVETIRSGIRLSNGVAFSPDGSTIYHVDSLRNAVSRHSYGPGPFDSTEPWVTVLDDLPDVPDGLTVSADGSLWIAFFGGGGVTAYSPSGDLLDRVNIDAPQATCPAFVGPRRDILAIASARLGLDAEPDHSGAIFFAQVGATGLPESRWSGSTSSPSWTGGS